jgi:DNA-binding CsgD family transcriptional regulator
MESRTSATGRAPDRLWERPSSFDEVVLPTFGRDQTKVDADRLSEGTLIFNRKCAPLERLVGQTRSGQGGSLVVRGDAGVGKTTLLHQAAEAASDVRFVHVAGVEAESDLLLAAVHQLCGQFDGLDRLPGPQADALRAAFGLTDSSTPDPFFLGLAVRSLLAEAAKQRPLVCLVDDAQWLDGPSARTLVFVARRLDDLPVAIVFGAREPREELAGLPEVEIDGLSYLEARTLIDRLLPGPLDEEVHARLVAETEGNPLSIVELLSQVRPTAFAGGYGAPSAIPLPPAMEEAFGERLEQLSETTRRLLLLVAAEPSGRPADICGAAELLGIAGPAFTCPEVEAHLGAGTSLRFRHPSLRSAVYRAASPHERRLVHRALAQAIDHKVYPDRRAWHRGQATLLPDEDVAAELEQAAGAAHAKGGFPAAAALLARAAAVTPDAVRRSQRVLAAGQAKLAAGALDEAFDLLVTAEPRLLDDRQGALLQQLRAQVVVAQGGGSDTPALLLQAAKRLDPLDVRAARETYVEAFEAALHSGRLSGDYGIAETAEVAVNASPPPRQPRPVDVLLDGLATMFTQGYAAAVPELQAALGDLEGERETRWLSVGAMLATNFWDDARASSLAIRQKELALGDGALMDLHRSLVILCGLSVFAGDFTTAADLLEQARVICPTSGAGTLYLPLMLAAFRGQETEAAHLVAASIEQATMRGEGLVIGLTEEMAAVLYNSLGRYGEAMAAARHGSEHGLPGVSARSLAELVEAAVRCGERETAQAALAQLTDRTTLCGTDWALGVEARCRALLSEGKAAEELYTTAIEHLGRSTVTTALARAYLLHGEWLRGEGRRVDAREQLHLALQLFTSMGAKAFAARTERELLATGERPNKRRVESSTQLTTQEAEISQLACDGMSNPEIAAKLFISPRTVEYHLRKVFAKLGISSRNQLPRVLASANEAFPAGAGTDARSRVRGG